MRRIYFFFLTAIAVLALIIAIPAVLDGAPDSNELYFHDENLEENSNTTFITLPTNGMVLVRSYLIKDRDLNQQAKESTIIVKGQVIEIFGTVETKDLINAGMAEKIKQGYKFLHTDVLLKVDEYLGPNSLPFDELVLRRIGGKIEGLTYIVKQEHLTVGEEVIIFRLSRPEAMTQVPEGYSLEQYFLFQPTSKYLSVGENKFRASFKDETYDIEQIKGASKQANRNN